MGGDLALANKHVHFHKQINYSLTKWSELLHCDNSTDFGWTSQVVLVTKSILAFTRWLNLWISLHFVTNHDVLTRGCLENCWKKGNSCWWCTLMYPACQLVFVLSSIWVCFVLYFQMVTTIVVLMTAKQLKFVSFPEMSREMPRKVSSDNGCVEVVWFCRKRWDGWERNKQPYEQINGEENTIHLCPEAQKQNIPLHTKFFILFYFFQAFVWSDLLVFCVMWCECGCFYSFKVRNNY